MHYKNNPEKLTINISKVESFLPRTGIFIDIFFREQN